MFYNHIYRYYFSIALPFVCLNMSIVFYRFKHFLLIPWNIGDNVPAGRPSNWDQHRRPSYAGIIIIIYILIKLSWNYSITLLKVVVPVAILPVKIPNWLLKTLAALRINWTPSIVSTENENVNSRILLLVSYYSCTFKNYHKSP